VPPIVIDSGLGEPGSETGVGETGLECLSQLASVKKATVSGMIKTSRERRAVVAMTTSMALKSSTQFEYHGLFSNLGYMDSVSEEESLNVEHFSSEPDRDNSRQQLAVRMATYNHDWPDAICPRQRNVPGRSA
jgi:hypothetical protein